MCVTLRYLRSDSRWLSCLALLLIIGCGDGATVPPLGKVQGTVTLDGEPLPNAIVLFQPTTEKAGPSQGITDSDGKYSLSYLPNHPGAALAEHKVMISAQSGAAAERDPVPAKYNDNSDLKVTVEAGDNTHDFELLSN